MYSSMIGKIEKARWYAQERERLFFERFSASFRGEHGAYTLSYNTGAWNCTCGFFAGHGTCSHTMATQRMLEGMVQSQAPTATV